MKNIKLIIISTLLMCPFMVNGQGLDELVLQLSQQYPGGTARMLGLGGSKVALGGDLGNVYLNPAGLGFYNRSEWAFSPSLNFIQSSSDFLGNTTRDSKVNFNFGNLGVVFNRTKGVHNGSKWRGGSFAFSFNRTNNFHTDITYDGLNSREDIIDYAVEQENYFGRNDITDLLFETTVTGEFYVPNTGQNEIMFNGQTYPVDGLSQNDTAIFFIDRNIYTPEGDLAFPTENTPVRQREVYRTFGGQNVISLSYGGNYDDRVYFGFGVNVMSIDKEIERLYTENRQNADLSTLVFSDIYGLNGTGINGTFGLIVRPVETMLFGFSYTTPTVYGLEEIRDLEMTADFTGFDPITDRITYTPYFYNLRMPSRISGGLTYFLGKNGFLTADVETTRVGNSDFRNGDDGYQFEFENDIIRDSFDRVYRFGVGGEYRMDIWRLRAGFNHTTDPTGGGDIDYGRTMYSVGAGLRKRSYFIDFAYNLYQTSQRLTPYPTEIAVADTENTNHMTTLTFGFTF